MIRGVIVTFYGMVGSLILGVLSIAIVDGVFQKIIGYADIQPADKLYPAVGLLNIFCILCMFIPLEIAFVYLGYFYLRNIWQEAETF